jgi:crotonobetainyl-CoA:carnitine CoA-transferase CaiB-like acyl-CoA transferase
LDLIDLKENPAYKTNIERVSNRAALARLLQAKVGEQQADKLLNSLHELGVPAAKIKTLDQVFTDDAAKQLVRTAAFGTQTTHRVSQIAFKFEA